MSEHKTLNHLSLPWQCRVTLGPPLIPFWTSHRLERLGAEQPSEQGASPLPWTAGCELGRTPPSAKYANTAGHLPACDTALRF